jgi:predicted nucleic acid-binding protein
VIYADPSFLFSLYAWDENTDRAQRTYSSDQRRPLILTAWQRLELRNAVRLAAHRLNRSGQSSRFQIGNVLKRIERDLTAGRLRYQEFALSQVMALAEDLSAAHTLALGSAAVDLWHVAVCISLRADTFWTFDREQLELAKATGLIRRVPDLLQD